MNGVFMTSNYTKFLISEKEYKVYFSDHSKQRFEERHPNIKINKIYWMIANAYYNQLKEHPNIYNIIYSKSLEFGIVVNYKNKRFNVVTVLPKYKKNTNDNIVVVEKYDDMCFNNISFKYIVNLIDYGNLVLNESLDVERKEIKILDEDISLDAVFVDSKLYEFENIIIIEVF